MGGGRVDVTQRPIAARSTRSTRRSTPPDERRCAVSGRELPGVADAVDRAADTSPRLWDRRSRHPDAFVVSAGLGPVSWSAPVRGDRRTWSADVADAVERRGTLVDAPVEISVDAGQVIGVAGHRAGGAGRRAVRSSSSSRCCTDRPTWPSPWPRTTIPPRTGTGSSGCPTPPPRRHRAVRPWPWGQVRSTSSSAPWPSRVPRRARHRLDRTATHRRRVRCCS